jgi:hypothetical protein
MPLEDAARFQMYFISMIPAAGDNRDISGNILIFSFKKTSRWICDEKIRYQNLMVTVPLAAEPDSLGPLQGNFPTPQTLLLRGLKDKGVSQPGSFDENVRVKSLVLFSLQGAVSRDFFNVLSVLVISLKNYPV